MEFSFQTEQLEMEIFLFRRFWLNKNFVNCEVLRWI